MFKAKIKSAIRIFIETVFGVLLFGVNAFFTFGTFTMIIPLLPVMIWFLVDPHMMITYALPEYLNLIFRGDFVLARIIIYIGLAVLSVSAAQWLWYGFKRTGLFKKGLYSKVRHPQFLGIITVSSGITVMVATQNFGYELFPILQGGLLFVVGMWLTQALGYLALAIFEERRLTKKYGQEYIDYKQKTSMLFPIKNRTKLSELKFTIIILLIICAVILIVPFSWIGHTLGQYIPDWQF
jgi:protein-S-isoprenylcysteine O-methyltransferase Ste14